MLSRVIGGLSEGNVQLAMYVEICACAATPVVSRLGLTEPRPQRHPLRHYDAGEPLKGARPCRHRFRDLFLHRAADRRVLCLTAAAHVNQRIWLRAQRVRDARGADAHPAAARNRVPVLRATRDEGQARTGTRAEDPDERRPHQWRADQRFEHRDEWAH